MTPTIIGYLTMITVTLVGLALDNMTINSLALLGIALIGLWNSRKNAQIQKTASDTKKTADDTKTIAVATHTLSNSAMGAQLQMQLQFSQQIAVLARRIAKSGDPGDVAAATAADVVVKQQQEILQNHLVQQAKVDATVAPAVCTEKK